MAVVVGGARGRTDGTSLQRAQVRTAPVTFVVPTGSRAYFEVDGEVAEVPSTATWDLPASV